MTTLDVHVDTARLSAFLDDDLAPDERRRVETHLAVCARCAGQLDRLQRLVRDVRLLPDEIAPPAELWSGVRERLQRAVPASHPPAFSRWQLAAAAVVLVGVTSAITTLLVRRPAIVVERVAPPVTPAALPLVGPARAIDADYATTIRQLNEALAEHRAELDPATIAKVETSLRVIDEAIAEARHALAGDPANRTLLDILAANYQRKLELLQRATELPPTT